MGASEQALDLLGHMLVFNPLRRFTATAALDHPFFREVRKEKGIVFFVFFVHFSHFFLLGSQLIRRLNKKGKEGIVYCQ